MTGTDLKNQIERILRDTANKYWTEPEILDFINEAQKDFVKSVKMMEKRDALVVLDAAKGLYTLPADLVLLKRVFTATQKANPTTTKELDFIDEDWEGYPAGSVQYYYMDGLGLATIGMYPRG